MLVHAFIMAEWTTAPRSVTDRLQWVLNATAHLIGGMCKYDQGLAKLLHADLHWLDVADCVRYKLAITVHQYMYDKVPKHLTGCCVAVSDIAGRQRLRISHCRLLDVLHYQRNTLGRSVSVKRRHSVFDAQNFGQNARKRKTVRQVTQRIFR